MVDRFQKGIGLLGHSWNDVFCTKIEFHVPGARGDCDDVVSIAPWVENWDSIARNGDFGMKFVTVSRGTALFGFNGGLMGVNRCLLGV